MWSNTSISYCEVLLSNRTSGKIGVAISLSLSLSVSLSPVLSLEHISIPCIFWCWEVLLTDHSASAGLVCVGESWGVGWGGALSLSQKWLEMSILK